MRKYVCMLAIFGTLLYSGVSSAKIYWLPDYLGKDMERTYVPKNNGTDNPNRQATCADYGYLTADEKGNMACRSASTVAGTCYYDCTCSSEEYPYIAGGCGPLRTLGGTTCVDGDGVTRGTECVNICETGTYHKTQIAAAFDTSNPESYKCTQIDATDCYNCIHLNCVASSYDYTNDTCTGTRVLGGKTCNETDGTVYGTECNCPSGMIDKSAVSAKEKDGYVCTLSADNCYTCTKVTCDSQKGWKLCTGGNTCCATGCASGYATTGDVAACGTAPTNSYWYLTAEVNGMSGGKDCFRCESACNKGYYDKSRFLCNTNQICTWTLK